MEDAVDAVRGLVNYFVYKLVNGPELTDEDRQTLVKFLLEVEKVVEGQLKLTESLKEVEKVFEEYEEKLKEMEARTRALEERVKWLERLVFQQKHN